MPNPRWGFKIPEITSSNEIDCKIQKITNCQGRPSQNTDYSDSDYEPSSFWETNITLSQDGPDYATVASSSHSYQGEANLYLLVHLGASPDSFQTYYTVPDQFRINIGCYHTYNSNGDVSSSSL